MIALSYDAAEAPVIVNQNGIAYPAWAGADTERLNARLRGVLRAATHVVYQGAFCKQAADEWLGGRRRGRGRSC